MTREEVVKLARLVRSLCPAQAFDEYTPDVWAPLLTAYRLDDAQEAVKRLGSRQTFISPAEIIAEVKTLRGERLADFQYEPSDAAPGLSYTEDYRRQIEAVADGRRPAVIRREVTSKPFGELIAGIGIGELSAAEPAGRGPLAVNCPTCGARTGIGCRSAGKNRKAPHGARKRLAEGEPTQGARTDFQALTEARRALDALTPEQRRQLLTEGT